jgi:Glycosyltransferase family 87
MVATATLSVMRHPARGRSRFFHFRDGRDLWADRAAETAGQHRFCQLLRGRQLGGCRYAAAGLRPGSALRRRRARDPARHRLQFFLLPPTFLLVCSALARLPYIAAFVVFETVTLGFYLLVMRRILGEHRWAIMVPLLAFPPVLWTIGIGQNGFLTAGLVGAATVLVDRRPVAAGLMFGALCCKPHFALLVPIALAAGGRWRAFAATLITALGLGMLSLALFGWQTWHDFLVAAANSRDVYASGRIPFGGFVTPFGAAMLIGTTPRLAGSCRPSPWLLARGLLHTSGITTCRCRSAPRASFPRRWSRSRWRFFTISCWPGSPVLGYCAPPRCPNGEESCWAGFTYCV